MNVAVEEDLKEKLFALFAELPAEMQAEIIDFAEFLREKERRKYHKNETSNQRIAGLNQGEIWMSDDFNDELPDEFWFGNDSKLSEENNESVDWQPRIYLVGWFAAKTFAQNIIRSAW